MALTRSVINKHYSRQILPLIGQCVTPVIFDPAPPCFVMLRCAALADGLPIYE